MVEPSSMNKCNEAFFSVWVNSITDRTNVYCIQEDLGEMSLFSQGEVEHTEAT